MCDQGMVAAMRCCHLPLHGALVSVRTIMPHFVSVQLIEG